MELRLPLSLKTYFQTLHWMKKYMEATVFLRLLLLIFTPKLWCSNRLMKLVSDFSLLIQYSFALVWYAPWVWGKSWLKGAFSPLLYSYKKIELEIERKSKEWKHKCHKQVTNHLNTDSVTNTKTKIQSPAFESSKIKEF